MAFSSRTVNKFSSGVLRRVGLKSRYQINRGFSIEERWQMLRSCALPGDRNVIDIGCNAGEFTGRFAGQGLFALGLDLVASSIDFARKRNDGTPNLAFGVVALSPANVNLLPAFDITLCLSVAHYWHREYGEEACWKMIASLIARSRAFIFEGASIRQKYGDTPPQIIDNDEASVTTYLAGKLAAAAGGGHALRYLGKFKSLGREEFRYMYVVEKR